MQASEITVTLRFISDVKLSKSDMWEIIDEHFQEEQVEFNGEDVYIEVEGSRLKSNQSVCLK